MYVTLPGAHEFAIRPQHYQHLAQKIAGKPEERIVSYLMLRSLKQARYAADPLGHFALAFDQYTHFTSPIRRYPDLIVHRLLETRAARHSRAGCRRRNVPTARGELESVAIETSEAERRADAAERELIDWKRAQFMEQHLGEEYDALIISVQKFGFFVELMEVFVEGLVPSSVWKKTPATAASIASTITPSCAAAARAPACGDWAIACASAPTASTPCDTASNFRWRTEAR